MSLKDQIARAKRLGQDRDDELNDLLNEKKKLEELLSHKRADTHKLKRDIDSMAARNRALDDKVKALRTQVERREDENNNLDDKVRDLHRRLDTVIEDNRGIEGEIQFNEDEINDLRRQIEDMEQDKIDANREYDDCKARNNDNARTISQLENQLFALERDLKHFLNMNENYRNEIIACEKSYQAQLQKNMDLTRDLDKLDMEHRYGVFLILVIALTNLKI